MSAAFARLGLALIASAALHVLVAVEVPIVVPRAAHGVKTGLRAWLVSPRAAVEATAAVPEAESRQTAPVAAPAVRAPSPPPQPTPTPDQPVTATSAEQRPPAPAGTETGQPIADRRVPPAEPSGPALELLLIDDPQFYAARQLDELPQLLSDVSDRYPDEVPDPEVSGTVTLRLLIDELGVVVEATVLESDPPGYFDEAALARFRGVLFRPGQRHGRPVKSRLLVQVNFDARTGSLKSGDSAQ